MVPNAQRIRFPKSIRFAPLVLLMRSRGSVRLASVTNLTRLCYTSLRHSAGEIAGSLKGCAEPTQPLKNRLSGVFFVLGIITCAALATGSEVWAGQPLFNVGYRVLDFNYQEGKREKTIAVAVWYPTAAKPRPHNYGGPTKGMVAVDAAPLSENGPYPMLVFSHSYGGGIGAVFFTELLAARGWIVAAPDHHDRHSAVRIRVGQVEDFNRRGFWRYSIAFLEKHVAQRKDAEKVLDRRDWMLTRYVREPDRGPPRRDPGASNQN
ncbi:hypothetical protein D1AOALGA4SA_9381 [Olavius algarvensis Delta 1 endosymbiont]|nr:hypothetical protein D1AOALGA4SA_9381 [Olavius algarvensis Delta 1 endosymbiont]